MKRPSNLHNASCLRAIAVLWALLFATAAAAQPDLAVSKMGPTSVRAGFDIVYTLTVTNVGDATAMSVNLTDTLPAGTTYVSLSSPQTGGFTSFTSPPVGQPGTVTISAPSVAAGATAIFDLTVALDSNTAAGTVISNTASVTTSSADPNSTNNSSTTMAQVAAVDLAVVKNAPALATAGSNITYTLTVTNVGGATATSVNLIDTLPAGTTYVSLSSPQTGGFTSFTSPPVGQAGTVTVSAPSVAAGATGIFDLVVAIDSGIPAGTAIANTASVTTASADANSANNSSTATTDVAAADLAVTKDGPASAMPGSNIAYTIEVTNAGDASAETVVVTDPLPADTTFVSLSSPQTGGFTSFTAPPVGQAGTLTISAPSVAAGATGIFNLVVALDPGTPLGTAITNTASVTTTSADSNSANDSGSATTYALLDEIFHDGFDGIP